MSSAKTRMVRPDPALRRTDCAVPGGATMIPGLIRPIYKTPWRHGGCTTACASMSRNSLVSSGLPSTSRPGT